jgi:hypothetical protein
VRRLVWQEIQSMHPRSAWPLGGELLDVEYRVAPDAYALGVSTDQGVNFQGFHARPNGFLLIVMDEAPGVSPEVYPAIEGIRAGGDVRVLSLGNPDVASGPFHDIFTADRAGWETHTIDAFDTPNFEDEARPGRQLGLEDLLALPDDRLDHSPRPYLISRRFVLEKYHEWGEDGALWQSKVRGRFPEQGEDALLSLSWLEAASRREIPEEPDHEWEAGVDVAGPGEDETVLVIRQGPVIRYQQWWAKADPRGEVLAALRPFGDRLKRIKVDTAGIGYYFAKHLEDNGFAGKVAHVNVGAAPRQPEKFTNLKAEAYWGLRDRVQAGDFAGLRDQTTLSQLAGIRYRQTPRGQTEIESKVDARKRGVKSPDRAEAVMLAFHSSPKTEVF